MPKILVYCDYEQLKDCTKVEPGRKGKVIMAKVSNFFSLSPVTNVLHILYQCFFQLSGFSLPGGTVTCAYNTVISMFINDSLDLYASSLGIKMKYNR